MDWELSFISKEELKTHVRATINKYSKEFNSFNVNTDDIGYFHRNIFTYLEGCDVSDKGWDVVYQNPNGVALPDGDVVSKVLITMIDKHNTMNSASARKAYLKMQHQLLSDDDCACFLAEAVASNTQNIVWVATVDGMKVGHKRIRRVSMDQFYAIVTGDEKAFSKLCLVLPGIITEVANEEKCMEIPEETVNGELWKASDVHGKLNYIASELIK